METEAKSEVRRPDRTGEQTISDDAISRMRPTVASAVRSLRERMPALRPNGIFRHPPDWTKEEMDFIADSLKMNVPIYTIANMVHCEQHTLSALISRTPELRRLKEQKYENLLEEAEYQADRLMKQGNPSVVIYVLQTLGRKKGWAADDAGGGTGDDGSRIVMGLIPQEAVEEAEREAESIRKADPSPNPAGAITDPVALAAIEGAVKTEVARKSAELSPETIEVEGTASAPAYEERGASVVELAEQSDFSQYGATGFGAVNPAMGGDDPWASGADSMFFQ